MGRRLQLLWVVGSYLLTMVVGLFSNTFQNAVSKFAVLGMGLVLSLGMFYSKHYRPIVAVDRAKLEKFCEVFLFPRLRQAYIHRLGKALREEHGNSSRAKIQAKQRQVLNGLRINVMLYRRRDFMPWGGPDWVAKFKPWQKSLMIEFTAGVYEDAEKNLKWREGIGCCGHAASGDAYAGDIRNEDPERWDVPPTYQESLPDGLGSVLSIPIHKQTRGKDDERGPLVAVLNIDSDQCLEETYFEEEHVIEPLVKRASFLGVFL